MKSKIKGKSFQKLKKRGNKHWGYPIKIRSTKIKVQAKQKYKDTVFTKLFNNKAAAIQLYNALYQKNLPEDTPVEIVTLIYPKRKYATKATTVCSTGIRKTYWLQNSRRKVGQ